MRAGPLRHRIKLLDLSSAANASDSLDRTHTVVDTVWASVTALRGGRYVYGEQVEEVATHEIVIRYRTDYRTAFDWIEYDGRRLKIHEIGDPDGRKVELRILAEDKEAAA